MGDIGINTTTSIIEHLKEEVEEKKIKEPSECKQLLIDEIKRQMDVGDTAYELKQAARNHHTAISSTQQVSRHDEGLYATFHRGI